MNKDNKLVLYTINLENYCKIEKLNLRKVLLNNLKRRKLD